MSLRVVHGFQSGKSDSADVTDIQPSHWNANHTVTGVPDPYVDLRDYGAVADGVTNCQSAVAAAIADGKIYLYIPANCIWTVPGSPSIIPDGLRILGENWETSKIYSTPGEFLALGKLVEVRNVALKGKTNSVDAPVCYAYNGDPSYATVIQAQPYLGFFASVGRSPAGHLPLNDVNAISVQQTGDGGGIYGQYDGGGTAAEGGSGIHAFQASSTPGSLSAGLRVTKAGTAVGTRFETGTGGETGIDILYSNSVKTAGDAFHFFHSISSWSGNLISCNVGAAGGSFNGDLISFTTFGTRRFRITNFGGIVATSASSINAINFIDTETGVNNAIVGDISEIPLVAGLEVRVKLAHTLQAGANTFNFNSNGAKNIKSCRNPANNIGTAYSVGGIVTLIYDGTSWLDASQ